MLSIVGNNTFLLANNLSFSVFSAFSLMKLLINFGEFYVVHWNHKKSGMDFEPFLGMELFSLHDNVVQEF